MNAEELVTKLSQKEIIQKVSLDSITIEGIESRRAVFLEVQFKNVVFKNVLFVASVFEKCRFEQVTFESCTMQLCTIISSTINQLISYKSSWIATDLNSNEGYIDLCATESDFSNSKFRGQDLKNCAFINCNLTKIKM